METYKNDYTKDEDELLWEIHNIRHELTKEIETQTVESINKKYVNIYQKWEKEFRDNLTTKKSSSGQN